MGVSVDVCMCVLLGAGGSQSATHRDVPAPHLCYKRHLALCGKQAPNQLAQQSPLVTAASHSNPRHPHSAKSMRTRRASGSCSGCGVHSALHCRPRPLIPARMQTKPNPATRMLAVFTVGGAGHQGVAYHCVGVWQRQPAVDDHPFGHDRAVTCVAVQAQSCYGCADNDR